MKQVLAEVGREDRLRTVALDDKFLAETGPVYLTGTQALVRLPLDQKRRDRLAGRNTAGLISGYRGSPLGVYDQELWRAKTHLAAHDVVFQPGLNEDLAATALWGSQQIHVFGQRPKYDGVFGIWYGKNPGFDRSGDALKHANYAGTSRFGGVLAAIGDDHAAKSSDIPNQCEYGLMNHMMPVLYPSDIQDVLDFGLIGFELSRFSGCWVGFKIEPHTLDRSVVIETGADRLHIVAPTDFDMPPGGLNLRWPDNRFEQEARTVDFKLRAAQAFARANPALDRTLYGGGPARIGIVTAGKSYLDVREALDELGLDEGRARAVGLRVYKLGLTWPIEPEGAARFCAGLQELLVVEEKGPVIEDQLRSLLYNRPASQRPRIVGKHDEAGAPLFSAKLDLDPVDIAVVIGRRILALSDDPELRSRLERIEARRAAPSLGPSPVQRAPYFCSGCPHNTSIVHPDGTRAMGGIGCHWMAVWTPDFTTEPSTQMGGEGLLWVGQAPFVAENHVFQNLGDGTYYHSGSTAIRAAVAAGVNITYKLLYNDAVAMTGGQPVEGTPTVPQITLQLHAEGVRRIVVMSDEPDKFERVRGFAPGVTVRGREDLQAVQDELRTVQGVTALVYDQTCAAEKRRRRKKKEFTDPPVRMFINEDVCEGCGDCGRKSNCISIEPLETEWGRKRAINQSSCNKDYSCNKGFCPSFVTVENATLRKRPAAAIPPELAGALPEPVLAIGDETHNLLITGIGGTGIVTLGAVIGMAAHLDGRGASVLDSIGLAQKNGAVVSHVRIAQRPDMLHSARVPTASADALIASDLVVAADREVLEAIRAAHTRAIVNDHIAPTAAFVRDPDVDFRKGELISRVAQALGRNGVATVDAHELALGLLGDAIAMNLFMLGMAFQSGLVPVTGQALVRAIELNGVSVAMNKAAFTWGRIAANDRKAAERCAGLDTNVVQLFTLDQRIERRAAFLVRYGGAKMGRRYRNLVDRVRAAEKQASPASTELTEAVVGAYFKLLAYKDEYEVARLYADPAFLRRISDTFEDGFKLNFNLSPPLLGGHDGRTGEKTKRRFGPYMLRVFRILARLRFLRGTPLDPFGYQAERRMERRLIRDYEATIGRLLPALRSANISAASEIARLPERMRGFGHIKARNVQAARAVESDLLTKFGDTLAEAGKPSRAA